jgi:hypothetical protein
MTAEDGSSEYFGLTRRNVLAIVSGTATASALSSGSVTAQAADRTPIKEDSLLARWEFADGFEDSVGSIDGSVGRGDPTTGTYGGRSGMALDGDDALLLGSELENSDLSFLRATHDPVSITGWVYFDQEEGGSLRSDEGNHHILRNNGEYVIEADRTIRDPGRVELRFGVSGRDGASYDTKETTDEELYIEVKQWQHFAFVVDSRNYLIAYINGEEVFRDETFSGYSGLNTGSRSYQTIGGRYGIGSLDWEHLLIGKLSDLRIYNEKLSADNIEELYENTINRSVDVTADSETINADETDTVTVTVQLTDSDGNTVSKSGVDIDFTIEEASTAGVDLLVEDTETDSSGEASLEFTVENPDIELNITAESEYGSDSVLVRSVEPPKPEFSFGELAAPTEIIQNKPYTVQTTITNSGDASGTQLVSYILTSSSRRTRIEKSVEISLEPAESTTISFEIEEVLTRDLRSGDGLIHVVASDDDKTRLEDIKVIETDRTDEYTNSDGYVNSEGLLDAGADHRNGEIDEDTLSEVVSAFRSGEPLS